MSVFKIVRGVEGDCLVLDDTRICGPKPWGGGRIIKTFHTDGIYEVIDKDEYHKLRAENAKLRMLIDLKQTCWKYVGWCYECPYNGLDDEHDDCNCTVREKVNSLARELGIEV